MIRIKIKPLSVNDAWKGQRFKTKEYKQYEQDLMFILPKTKIILEPKRSIKYILSLVLVVLHLIGIIASKQHKIALLKDMVSMID